jgi:DNA polymerase IIIc chi subunit
MEINFYQLENIDYKAIAAILLKIREEKKRTLIYCKNSEILKQIDDGLWSFSKTKFLPHATKLEKVSPKDQPTFLTDEENNENDAEFLIMLDPTSDEFLKKFEKIFYFFGNSNLEKARELYREYKKKSLSLNFYKKDADKWVKV